MKRVHGYEEADNDDNPDRGYTDSSARRKKSNVSHHVPMKRTSSSKAHNGHYRGASGNVSAPRYVAQAARELQARNIMIPGMNSEEVNYAPQEMNQPYGNYTQSVY